MLQFIERLKKSKNQGFSLIELFVILGIIGSITTLSIVSIKEGERSFSLDQATEKFISDIETMRSNAQSGIERSDTNELVDVWGVHLDLNVLPQTDYTLFSSVDNNLTRDPLDDGFGTTLALENNIAIASVSSPIAADEGAYHIAFQQHSGRFFINSFPVNDNFTVTLVDAAALRTTNVNIGPIGIIGSFDSVCGNDIIEVGEECDNFCKAVDVDVVAGCTKEEDSPIVQCTDISPLYIGGTQQCNKPDDLYPCVWNNLNNCTLPTCGNEIVEVGEDCDDGNLVDGDGCSSLCVTGPADIRLPKVVPPSPPTGPPGGSPLSGGSGFSFGFPSINIGGLGGVGGVSGVGCFVIPVSNNDEFQTFDEVSLLSLMLLFMFPIFSVYLYGRNIRKRAITIKI